MKVLTPPPPLSTLFVVRWNKIVRGMPTLCCPAPSLAPPHFPPPPQNGKAAAVGCIAIALLAAVNSLSTGLSGWHIIALVEVGAAAHLWFNANPMLTSAMLIEKERKKAEKLAEKAK